MFDELKEKLTGRVVIVGVGDERKGDDGAGPFVARLLAEAGVSNVIDAGNCPEVETWRIREAAPDTVLFVDVVDVGGTPGDAAVLEAGDLRSQGFDTHRAPLRLTMHYLESELGCKCLLLAIQPRDIREGAPMCAEVKLTCESLAEQIARFLIFNS